MKKYEELEMEIVRFDMSDVIATSPTGSDGSGSTGGGTSPVTPP